MIVLIVFAYFAGRNPQLVPRGAQNVFEFILEALLSLVQNTAGSYARRVFPLIATLFLFIITANYMGLLPGLGTILVPNPNVHAEAAATTHAFVRVAEASPLAADPVPADGEHHEPAQVPLLRAANADVNMTLGMALVSFLFIHGSGIYVHKLAGYWKELSTPALLTPVKIVIECFLPVSLSMRLFGNIFGGEMLLAVMAFPVVAVPFMIMELLFGFIQALIFSMLTLIFTSLAVQHPAGHEGEAHGAGHGPVHDSSHSGAPGHVVAGAAHA
jgi:F-type H+-transporting ATPase subunit a